MKRTMIMHKAKLDGCLREWTGRPTLLITVIYVGQCLGIFGARLKHVLTVPGTFLSKTFFVEIARCHLGGFGRSLKEILPTSHSELPIQLTDLRNNQKSLKPNFIETIQNTNKIIHLYTIIYIPFNCI